MREDGRREDENTRINEDPIIDAALPVLFHGRPPTTQVSEVDNDDDSGEEGDDGENATACARPRAAAGPRQAAQQAGVAEASEPGAAAPLGKRQRIEEG